MLVLLPVCLPILRTPLFLPTGRDIFSVELQACDSAANRFRSWRVVADRDLFGGWCVRVTFGRIGCEGRALRREFDNEAAVRGFLRQGLRRRARAIRRIGVAYRAVSASPAAAELLVMIGIPVLLVPNAS